MSDDRGSPDATGGLPLAGAAEAGALARLAVAVRSVRAAAATTLRWFTTADLAVTEKADASPVTEADRAAERQLRRDLLEAFPGDAFLGEETGTAAGTSGYEWVVDPVDGTKSFIHGVPLYATLVGCRHAGRGLIGVIAIPALGELAYAVAGCGAWHARGERGFSRARVSARSRLAEGLLCTSDFVSFGRRRDAREGERCRAALERSCRLARTWGDGYGYMLVATGRAEVMIDPLMNAWDAAAVETVVVEAGGRFTDWRGATRIDAGEGVATNGLVHDEVLRVLAGA